MLHPNFCREGVRMLGPRILLASVSLVAAASCGSTDKSESKIQYADHDELKQVASYIVQVKAGSENLLDGMQSTRLAALKDQNTNTELIIFRVDFASAESAFTTLESWKDESALVSAEPNGINQTFDESRDEDFTSLALTYQEGMRSAFWLKKIHLAEAFQSFGDTTRSDLGRPIIAVLDSGVDIDHPALEGQIYHVSGIDSECGDDRNGCDVTQGNSASYGNGPAFPVGTKSFGESCPYEFRQVCPHGTHIAGIIAANPMLGYGGICPDCLILPVKVVSEQGSHRGTIVDSSIISAFGYLSNLKDQGVDIRIVNASFGKFRRSRAVSLVIRELARKGNGVLIVAAAGNENTQKPQYPAALDEVLAVANIDSVTGERHETSNFGEWVDIAAPGSGPCATGRNSGILSSTPGGGAECATGTSFAAPMVSGVAGLLLTKEPNLSAEELRQRLLASANEELDQVNLPFRGKLGAGIVDAAKALSPGFALVDKDVRVGERVHAGCGVIGGKANPPNWVLLWLLLPFLALFMRSRGENDYD